MGTKGSVGVIDETDRDQSVKGFAPAHIAEKARNTVMPDVTQIEARLLDYKQAAVYLNIGKSTLYALVSEGQLTCVQFGVGKTKKGVTRFRREDLEAFVKAKVRRGRG